ncbi:hypothetical protein GCM10008955_12970 [Deinococcus malanensis]|uniref:Uncharacterized protein n=2 Tax=Deinococcus malanensis TaxID=1706855 RepID=A0ABQ2ETB6_9DEIO|nr:hypothetical protein GCM10008955_12970 [Deinococcus malanensis]
MLSGSKTFTGLKAGSVLSVEGGAVNNFTAPSAQNVTLDADKTVTLTYQPLVGSALSQSMITGQVTGTDLEMSNAYVGSAKSTFFGKIPLTRNSMNYDLSALVPGTEDLVGNRFGQNCTGTNSDASARTLYNSRLAVYGVQDDLLGTVVEKIVGGQDATRTNPIIVRLYSDRAFTFTGTCTYPAQNGTSITEAINISVSKGWNALVSSTTGTALDLRNVSTDNRVQLVFESATPSVTVLLNPKTVQLTTDSPVTVDAEVVQVGGYTGTIHLSTNIPGLTVEPAVLTLPALPKLSAQSTSNEPHQERVHQLGLKPQLVATKLTFQYSGTDNRTSSFQLIVKDAAGKQVGAGNGSLVVARPSFTLSTSGYNLQLPRNSSLKVPVTLSATQNFTGDVTVSATDLPAGVTVTPITLKLNGSAYGEVTLTSDSSVAPGTYPITLTANGGGKSSSAKVNLVVPKPSVNVSVGTYSAYVSREGEASISVNVSSVNGFDGTTTLTLADLPTGVTATPVTAQVSPTTSTTVKIPVTAAAAAVLGTYTVKVSTPDLSSTSHNASFQLSVMPKRVLVGSSASSLTPSGTGVWLVTGSAYNSTTYKTDTTVSRYVSGKQSASVTLADMSSPRLLPKADGSVLAMGYYSGTSAFTVSTTGTATATTHPFSSNDTIAGVPDTKGRIWFIQRASTGVGGMTTGLAHWDPATGTVVQVDSATNYGYSQSGQFVVSPDGTTLLFVPSYSGSTNKVVKINAAAGTISTIDLISSYSFAIDKAGTIWMTDYNQLKRLNADGSITTFTNLSLDGGPQLIGFDRSASHILWGRSYSGVVKIDTTALSATKIMLTGNISGAVAMDNGGISVMTSEYTGQSSYYLSTLE